MAAAGMAVLAPHVIWLIENKDTLAYATARVGAGTGSLRSSVKYTLGSIAWIVAALAMWAILLRPRWQAIRDTLVPQGEQRRLALWAFLLPNMLPVTVAIAASIEITPIWTLPGYTLLPLVLLSSPLIEVTKEALSRAIGAAAAVTFALLLCSPTIALVTHGTAKPHGADYAWMLTHDIQGRWRATTERPITTVFSCGPDREVAAAVGWKLGVPTRMLYGRPGISARADLLSHGGIIVGAATDPECQEQLAISRLRERSYLMLQTYRPRLFGIAGRSYSYFAMIVPPETDAGQGLD
jgi:hypothetical protein